jgi:hypothetical protein
MKKTTLKKAKDAINVIMVIVIVSCLAGIITNHSRLKNDKESGPAEKAWGITNLIMILTTVTSSIVVNKRLKLRDEEEDLRWIIDHPNQGIPLFPHDPEVENYLSESEREIVKLDKRVYDDNVRIIKRYAEDTLELLKREGISKQYRLQKTMLESQIEACCMLVEQTAETLAEKRTEHDQAFYSLQKTLEKLRLPTHCINLYVEEGFPFQEEQKRLAEMMAQVQDWKERYLSDDPTLHGEYGHINEATREMKHYLKTVIKQKSDHAESIKRIATANIGCLTARLGQAKERWDGTVSKLCNHLRVLYRALKDHLPLEDFTEETEESMRKSIENAELCLLTAKKLIDQGFRAYIDVETWYGKSKEALSGFEKKMDAIELAYRKLQRQESHKEETIQPASDEKEMKT